MTPCRVLAFRPPLDRKNRRLQNSVAFKEKIDLPVIRTAKISEVATARHAIQEWFLELVGMTRAYFADPHFVNKIAAGEKHRIRSVV